MSHRRDLLTDKGLSEALRALPARFAPSGLTTSLRVIASRERQRRVRWSSLSSILAFARERLELFSNNLVRPLALPLAGGLFSAVALLSVWLVPTYPVRADNGADVPTMLTTEATVKGTAPISTGSDDVVVDVRVDDQGRMIDYTIVSGVSVLQSDTLRRSLENTLLFTVFTPATAFGQPTAGKMRLQFGSSRIDVKG